MDKKFWLIVLLQFILSVVSGFLISKMSFLGRVGINFFYQEYAIFKVWWQTALLFFGIQFFLMILQSIAKTKLVSWVILIISIAGLVYVFIDFNNTFSYKILKEKFHVGFYLFFISTIIHCVYFLIRPKPAIRRM